jgi:hypothetical protein
MRGTAVLALTGVALLLAPRPGFAQGLAPSAVQLAAMRPFERWIGEWKGTGWSTSASGKRTDFTIVETVQHKVGGTVLLLDGRGEATAASGEVTVTHDGLVVLSYDEKSGRYRWNGREIGREPVDAEVKLLDGGLEWSIPAGGGATVRFTIQFDGTRWHEVGDVSMDGTTWTRFMEMNLLRQ